MARLESQEVRPESRAACLMTLVVCLVLPAVRLVSQVFPLRACFQVVFVFLVELDERLLLNRLVSISRTRRS